MLLVIASAAPAARGRRRSFHRCARALLTGAALLLVAPLGAVRAAPAGRSCATAGEGWCVARRISSEVPEGELGFRFGAPLDVDGDGVADPAAGARFALRGVHQDGWAGVWSGKTGARLRAWVGTLQDGLFGHWVLPIPDLDGDHLADVIIAAPNAAIDGVGCGMLYARSPRSGEEIWRQNGPQRQNLGWDLDLAGDQDGDGLTDVFAGAPGVERGTVFLLSGKDGSRLHTYAPPGDEPTFGWYVATLDDLDGDGCRDLAAGAHLTRDAAGAMIGAAYVFSAATGKLLHQWRGADELSGFGEVVAAVGDLDGDGRGEVAVAAPRTNDQKRDRPGDVFVYSGESGELIRHLTGKQPGELFGRMVAAAGDVNGDGSEDLAVGAPWFRSDAGKRAGRVELFSGRDGTSLGELVGRVADAWFGWHIRRAPDVQGEGRPALLIASLRQPVNGVAGTGVLELYVLRDVRERSGAAPAAATSSIPAERSSPPATGP